MPQQIKSKLGRKIVEGIEAGAEFTISEWAKELSAKPDAVSRALTYLRKKGYLFYPLQSQEGKVLSILKKNAYIDELTQRHDKNYLLPHLESAFRIIKISLHKYPELHGQMEHRLTHFLNLISSNKREIKQLGGRHGNS